MRLRTTSGPDLSRERSLWAEGKNRVAGVDEVGRGALAGCVLAAAIVLPPDCDPDDLAVIHDSKALSPKRRREAVETIRKVALAIGIGAASPREIDRLNIARATALAMRRALARCGTVDHVLVDGVPVPDLGYEHTAIVKGDAQCLSIAAASCIAKELRDQLMKRLAVRYPDYGWDRNVGYGSHEHREAIERLGLTPHHRQSFGQFDQLVLFLST